jgi:LysM repeat protein
MDAARVWLARLAAPLAFLAAATILVVVVQRALEGDGATATEPALTTPAESTPSSEPPGDDPAVTLDDVPVDEQEFYRIKEGDNLEAIATEFATTVDQLLALNPELDSTTLQIGQRIRVR